MLGRTRQAGQGRLAKRMGGTYTEAGDVTHCQVTQLPACLALPLCASVCVCVSLSLSVSWLGVVVLQVSKRECVGLLVRGCLGARQASRQARPGHLT